MNTNITNEPDKVTFSSKDFLSLQGKLQSYLHELVDQASAEHPDERVFLQNEMNQWTSSLLTCLAENSTFTDSNGFDIRAQVNPVDPVDEELKAAVKKEEADFKAHMIKVVKYRAQVPSILAQLSQEICECKSRAAEHLDIELPPIENDDKDYDLPLDTVKKEYTDAMQMLSQLNKMVPEELDQIERLSEITNLVMKQN
ncbi:hypothetical protein [Parasitella parasitica]|uniref:Uncharacterized protein n=1 Tax=Parasitella parasitica TaxID=35722 RepID=A0A0B7MVF7_9FUNG|nr:hypothetical protein [Parasitella parasitica]